MDYDLTKDEKWKKLAEKYTEDLDSVKYLKWHHDVGFNERSYYNTGTAKRFTIKQRIKTGRTGRANGYFKIGSWQL